MCDSVVIMSDGTLIAQGAVSDILRSEDRVRLKTTDDEKAVAVLSAVDWIEEVKMESGEVVVAAPGDRTADISTVLGRADVYVIETISDRGSLEEYFLEVTGDQEMAELGGRN